MRANYFLTLCLGALSCLLMLLPPEIQTKGYFDYDRVIAGEYWRLITGHWLHGDAEHLLWNVAGLVILASIIERRSCRLLLASIAIGMLSVDMLLLSAASSVQYYIGLSGMLNTLMAVVLAIYWYETQSPIVILVALLCVGKIVVEMSSGHAIFTDTSWPSYAIAHLAGFLGASFLLLSIDKYHRLDISCVPIAKLSCL